MILRSVHWRYQRQRRCRWAGQRRWEWRRAAAGARQRDSYNSRSTAHAKLLLLVRRHLLLPKASRKCCNGYVIGATFPSYPFRRLPCLAFATGALPRQIPRQRPLIALFCLAGVIGLGSKRKRPGKVKEVKEKKKLEAVSMAIRFFDQRFIHDV